jgi:signal transduction histidine kinase
MNGSDDIVELRRCIRDLVSLTALPAMWTGKGEQEIAEGLADVLLGMFRLDLAYCRIYGADGSPDIDVAREAGSALPVDSSEIARVITQQSGLDRISFTDPADGRAVYIACLPIRQERSIGLVAAGSKDPAFPSALDRLLLEVSVNQASMAIHNCRLLAQVSRERTEAQTAREMLRRSNEDLRQFNYIASHDLQEPLRTINSFGQLLQLRYHGRLERDADEFIGYITSSAQRMSALLRDLLNYAEISKTERPPRAQANMTRAVEAAMSNLRSSIEESGATFTVGDLPRVPGDELQLVEVFQNLIANAIKYRGDEPPRIRVFAEARSGEWIFSVCDNGIGIQPQYHERIFGLFKRLHGRELPGTGLGLAICKQIVEQHQGRIWVEAGDGPGTTFCFALPGGAYSAASRAALSADS